MISALCPWHCYVESLVNGHDIETMTLQPKSLALGLKC